jgi:hypothetical protein
VLKGDNVDAQSGPNPVPYDIIAACIRSGSVIPFLGAAASYVGAPKEKAVVSASQLTEKFAKISAYPGPKSDPLTKVAQYLDEVASDREFLLNLISEAFFDAIASDYSSAFTDFLMSLEPSGICPPIIITTNYDVIIERALEKVGREYIAISHVFSPSKFQGRYICYENMNTSSDSYFIMTKKEVEDRLQKNSDATYPAVIVYKMHGTAFSGGKQAINSVVITENDYIDFMGRDLISKIPVHIQSAIRKSRMLFLGYSMSDWNFRILLHRLRENQRTERDERKHWACKLGDDNVESEFWRKRGVNIYTQPLDIFLNGIANSIQGRGAT